MSNGVNGPDPRRPGPWRPWATGVLLGACTLGLFWRPLGAWTGPVLGAWFMSTQPSITGWLVLGITGLPGIGTADPTTALARLLLGTLPFLLFRAISGRRPDPVSACSLPCWGMAGWGVAQHLGWGIPNLRPMSLVASLALGGQFTWMVSGAPGTRRWPRGLAMFSGTLAAGWALMRLGGDGLAWGGFSLGVLLGLRAVLKPSIGTRQGSVLREHLSWLRTPGGSQALSREEPEALAAPSGNRYRIQRGIPVFQESAGMIGPDRIYHRLYQGIGGFYDDIQRVHSALRGVTLQQRLWQPMQFLDVPEAAAVLETSVGTGLNLTCLPEDARIFGLDLSLAMLERCARNLVNWRRSAVLVQGNAESLPFPDEAFDAVFHIGGINFFSDRAAAIREMVRVAKPGTRLLIADETETHVRTAYERTPLLGRLFRNRKDAVTPPLDLVPPGMEEIRLMLLNDGRFYALTFRKP